MSIPYVGYAARSWEISTFQWIFMGIMHMTNIVTHFMIVSIHHSHVFNMMQKVRSDMEKQGSFTQFMMCSGS